ncbi:MAG: type VI secretion system tip protein VgrG [Deltaproteobacteria bacterium]|nr:type VI secretion system tip protein VgrG [Deltaproteobacteria bacterium]
MNFTQENRQMEVTTPLGKDKLLLVAFAGQEAISQLFSFQLDLLAENNAEISFDKLLGEEINIRLDLPDGKKRHFSGICKRISQRERDFVFTAYRMEIVPELWLLTKKAQSRIFQQMTAPDILKKALEGFDVSYEIQGDFHPRDFCLQYRETDFNFVSRLMEEEGIYYFFKHTEDGHKMVVANTPQSHPDLPVASKIIFEEVEEGQRDEDRIFGWEKVQELRSGKYTLWDHCFELPHKHLEAEATIKPESLQAGRVTHKLKVGDNDKLEIYDFPGEYAQRFDGVDRGGGDRSSDLQKIFKDNQRTVDIRMAEETVPSLVIEGTSNCRQFVSGHKFTLQRHFNADGQYVIASVTHSARQAGDFRSNGEGFDYSNTFTCIPFAVPFRPQRVTPKPVIQGTQTAFVVGPAGEEIFTDKYGRVKVQFHWDREGKDDEKSSCWIRVGTLWAGKQWGSMFIPRIGQEVMVDFLEGDPDQPIIVGSVYNAENMPHYKLPEFKTLGYIKSNSSKGGKGFNEIRFEDKKGEEQVFMHSQKRMDVRVLASYYETNHADRHTVVGWEKGTEQGGDLNVLVNNDHNVHIKGGRYDRIEKVLNLTVVGDVVRDLQSNEATLVTGKSELNAREVIIEALTKISLKVGPSFVLIDPSGVTIYGPTVKINSGGFGTETGDPFIEDPLDAATSDTGEPGYLEKLKRQGGGGRRGRTRRRLRSQHAKLPPRPGEDPRITAMRNLLHDSATGRHALEVYDRHGVNPAFAPGSGSTFDGSTNTMNLDPTESPMDSALTFVHEMNHAEAHHEGRSPDINDPNRNNYVNGMVGEESEGTVRSIQARDELADAGHDVSGSSFPLQNEYHDAYNQAVADARAANPNASAEELDAAGRAAGTNRVNQGFQNGEVVTSNTNQSYPTYYGNAWDGAHPPPAGGGGGP